MNFRELTVTQIKEFLAREGPNGEALASLADDPRVAVRRLYAAYQKQKAAWEAELNRLRELRQYEEDLFSRGYRWIAGVDEAGRGPLAGPVVAAAVILAPGALLPGLNDSKKVAPAKRTELAARIREEAIAWQVAVSPVEEIDRLNIFQASLQAMKKAVAALTTKPEFVLVDAVTIPGLEAPQLPIIRGDSLSASIAAASILAKVTRDELMIAYSRDYPAYGFERHKGYGTAEHLEAIRNWGPCPLHRRSFLSWLEE